MRKLLPYLLILPTFLIIVPFIYYPAADSFYLSFFRVSIFGNRRVFVGFENFVDVLTSEKFISALRFTLLFTASTVFLSLMLSFFVALMLNERVPGVRIFRTMIFAPYAVSNAVAGALWGFMLNPVVGHVNYLMARLFGVQANWLTSVPHAAYAVIIAEVWKTMPFNTIFYLAGLQSIPDELIESARIDGASAWHRMWKITFPLLSPITYYLVIMGITSAMFQSFAIIDVMTKGGPGDYTTNLIYRAYLDGFRFSKIGPASAQSVMLFAIMLLVTVLYFKFGGRTVHYQ